MERALLFCICIGTRASAAWLAYSRPNLLEIMGAIAAVISVSFAAIYAFGLRTTGPEVFGERIWWNDLRPMHALLYGLFAHLALRGSPDAWTFLAADVVFGAIARILHRGFC